MFGITSKDANRFKGEVLSDMNGKKSKNNVKAVNFGVSKADLKRYRKQARVK